MSDIQIPEGNPRAVEARNQHTVNKLCIYYNYQKLINDEPRRKGAGKAINVVKSCSVFLESANQAIRLKYINNFFSKFIEECKDEQNPSALVELGL